VLLIGDRFHSDPRVLQAGNRAVGSFVCMLSWLSDWPEETTIHPGMYRPCGATRGVIKSLIDAELAIDSPKGLIPLGDGDLWKMRRIISRVKIPQALRDLVMERDEYTCQRCSATENLSLDHIIPYSFGGPDTEENLRVLCRSCNSSRGNRVEVEV
jgi:hypothetical protein